MSALFSRLARLALALTIGMTLCVPASFAADSNGRFSVRGLGGHSCADYLAATGKPAELGAYSSWLLGYATARSRVEAGTFDMLPTQGGLDFVNVVGAVCRQQQTALLETVADQTLRVLAPVRQAAETPLVQVQADSKSVAIRQASLQQLQTALIARKFYKGTATGAPSPQFIDALKAFQRKEGIAVTGLPDIDTFIRAIIKH